jgi:hypothetical protein
MKIYVICSKAFYAYIEEVKEHLEKQGHSITLPNCYDDLAIEDKYRDLGKKEYAEFKSKMFAQSEEIIKVMDAVLVLNFDKNGIKNYIGGATFLEMYNAFRFNKKIYLYNEIPDGMLKDEIIGFNPVIINGDLNKIA